MAFKLDPTGAISGEIIRVAREQLAEAAKYVRRRNEPIADRIHAGRTTCKKVRAALKLLRRQQRVMYRGENRSLRDAARKLSRLRDAETTLLACRTFLESCTPGEKRKFAPLERALTARRRAALSPRSAAERTLSRFAEQLEKAEVRVGCWELKEDLAAVVADHRRAYKRARAGLTGIQELGTATAFHEWRKVVKTYSYQCRLLRAAWPPAMKELRDELKQLGALLGDEHDLTILRKTLKRLHRKHALKIDDDTLAQALAAIEARRAALRDEAIPLGQRLFVDRPRVIAARLAQWWQIAQQEAAMREAPAASE
jgi:CHAD domain-containing protein